MTTYPVFQGATTDEWQQLDCPGAKKLRIQVSNAAVLINFGTDWPAPQWEPSPEPYLPILASLVRPFDAVRFMSMTAGVPAQIILIPTVA